MSSEVPTEEHTDLLVDSEQKAAAAAMIGGRQDSAVTDRLRGTFLEERESNSSGYC